MAASPRPPPSPAPRDGPSPASRTPRGSMVSIRGSVRSMTSAGDGRTLERANWARDEDIVKCQGCDEKFGILLRKHHCRACGRIFCKRCSSEKETLEDSERPGVPVTVRVCTLCASELRGTPSPRRLETPPVAFLQRTGSAPTAGPVSNSPPPAKPESSPSAAGVAERDQLQRQLQVLRRDVAIEERRLGGLHQMEAELAKLRHDMQLAVAARDAAAGELRRRDQEAARREQLATRAGDEVVKSARERQRQFQLSKHHAAACSLCLRRFTATRREHHCRCCFEAVCADCSRLQRPRPAPPQSSPPPAASAEQGAPSRMGSVSGSTASAAPTAAPERRCDWCSSLETVCASGLWARRAPAVCCEAAGRLAERVELYWQESGPKDETALSVPVARLKRPLLQPDKDWPRCAETACETQFSPTVRRHHCRACGYVFCAEHCSQRLPLAQFGYAEEQRVCPACFDKFK
eukprot:TRINITY_DN4187_c0_g1_i2.p1 TRINITY_DN4187_c0_g1~~TRINITY_DN4187_c0_g1_i2.p1  ORF type:complete len:464 (+),score=99.44 TRINITY_DN4187_c0_g1_i2:80-1471(+)